MKVFHKNNDKPLVYQRFENGLMEGSYSAKSADMFAARRSCLTSSANFSSKTLKFLKTNYINI
jgi:hypothetical protein